MVGGRLGGRDGREVPHRSLHGDGRGAAYSLGHEAWAVRSTGVAVIRVSLHGSSLSLCVIALWSGPFSLSWVPSGLSPGCWAVVGGVGGMWVVVGGGGRLGSVVVVAVA